MFTTDSIAALIPALPRYLGYQPRDVATVVAVDTNAVLAGTATCRDRERLDGQTIHQVMRQVNTANPSGTPIRAGLIVLWSSNDDSDLEWLALDVATSAHPSATPVTVVQADPDSLRWRHPAGQWRDSDPNSALVAHSVAEGLPAPTGGLADRLAAWHHDPDLAAAVTGHTDHTWIGNTLHARTGIVDDVWAVMLTANHDPADRPDALGTVIAALNGPIWLRDTLMLRAARHWPDVVALLAAAVRAASHSHTPNTAAVAAAAAFTAGDELAGREALIRAVAADPDHSLTALMDQAEAAGMPMTRTWRAVLGDMTETTTLGTGL